MVSNGRTYLCTVNTDINGVRDLFLVYRYSGHFHLTVYREIQHFCTEYGYGKKHEIFFVRNFDKFCEKKIISIPY